MKRVFIMEEWVEVGTTRDAVVHFGDICSIIISYGNGICGDLIKFKWYVFRFRKGSYT
jgi:hypothetical protein